MRLVSTCVALAVALSGCSNGLWWKMPVAVIAAPLYIASAPQRREDELRQQMAIEEQAILNATTAEEAAIHKARWDIYAAHLRMSQEERARRRAEWNRRVEEMNKPPQVIQGGQQDCTGYIYQDGYFRAQCQ